MSAIFDEYLPLYKKLKELSDRLTSADQQLTHTGEQELAARQLRIERLEEQLEKIDEYRAKVQAYCKLAESHVTSASLLAVTARELNFKRMREWAQRITPGLEDDPYARRVLMLAKCNLKYLDEKEKEFKQTVAELKNVHDGPTEEELAAVKQLKRTLEGECLRLVESREFKNFVVDLNEAHNRYCDPARLQRIATKLPSDGAMLGIGGYAQPFPVLGSASSIVKTMLPERFDAETGSILLPVELPLSGKRVLSVACTAGREKRLYRAIQNYLLNLISAYPLGENRIYILDALHYNNTILGSLRPLLKSAVFEEIPQNAEAISDTLKGIVSGFFDADESLGAMDSVDEYNRKNRNGPHLARSTLVLVGYPTSFSSEAREYVGRILANAERYGVTVISIDSRYAFNDRGERERWDCVEKLGTGLVRVRMLQDRTMVSIDDAPEQHFRWYELKQDLSEAFVKQAIQLSARSVGKGNVYTDRVRIDTAPNYKRGMIRGEKREPIALPYGVNKRDEIESAVFDNDNFAAFVMGASGSGKSTLLHTLITGILAQYHPDEAELWLADFKMSEFAQYINPMPPHVKYILLDESNELVYDLLDKLTEVMMERQRFFAIHPNLKNVENVPVSEYMPVIFVILDEFSIMSQAIADSDIYKLKLQNLLAKGRALGIKFIFSSQTFTKGVIGLTSTAKEQIQMRIAMKNSRDEKQQTLGLSSGEMTDQVQGWMDALPPYFTLSKHYNKKTESNEVNRLKVLYFPGKGDSAMAPQRELIERIRKMKQVEDYNPSDPNCYVNKHPIVVNGNSYVAFPGKSLAKSFSEIRKQDDEINAEDVLLSLGKPRLLSDMQPIVLSPESRENLLLLTRPSENACSASIVLSAAQCFTAQGGRVLFLAHGKNRVYRKYRDSCWNQFEVTEGMDEVCDAIRELRGRIERQESQRELVVLLGIERIASEFEFAEGSANASAVKQLLSGFKPNPNALPKTEDEASFAEKTARWIGRSMQLEREARAKGLSDQEIEELLEREQDAFFSEEAPEPENEQQKEDLHPQADDLFSSFEAELAALQGNASDEKAADPHLSQESEKIDDKEESNAQGAYDATEDLNYILTHGSRLGYHFMVLLNSFADLKTIGFKLNWFRHRATFQISKDESLDFIGVRSAADLTEHVCQYSDGINRHSFRPYLHPGLAWDGWVLGADGKVIGPFDDTE